ARRPPFPRVFVRGGESGQGALDVVVRSLAGSARVVGATDARSAAPFAPLPFALPGAAVSGRAFLVNAWNISPFSRIMSRMSFLWYWPAGGWDVDGWKKSHPWEPARSEQSDHKELLPIGADLTRPQWEAQRARWVGVSDRILGTLTDRPPATMRHEFLT